MKELYGLRDEQVEKLKEMGYISNETIICNDGYSNIDYAPLYAVMFETSEDKDKAYKELFKTK